MSYPISTPLRHKRLTPAVCVATLVLTGHTAIASAQEQPLRATGQLEEVVVTARKREENLQDTPISIQAFTEAGLEMRNITEISQIGSFTPNMVFDRAAAIGGSNSTAIVYIRGIGQDQAIPTIDLGVGTYVDGVYLARAVGGVFDLVDVERIEVLRGPQGTLFGRNTIGGAISVTTQKPSEDFYSDLSVNIGTDDLRKGQASINGALTDSLFGKASFLAKKQDGYVDRPDGTDLGNEDTLAGRLAFRWEPLDSLVVDLAGDVTSSDSNGAPWTLVELDTSPPFPTFYNAFLVDPSEGCFGPNGSTDNPNPVCYNGQWIPNSDDQDFSGIKPEDKLDVWGVSGTISWDVNASFEIKSITSYRDTDSDFSLDQDHSPLTVMEVTADTKQDQFSQEFQFIGSAIDGALNYIVGLYYFEESATYLETVTFPPVFFQSGGEVDNDTAAVYAQGTYDFSEKLSLTLGARYTDETKRFTPDQFVISNNNDKVPPQALGFEPGQVPPSPPPGTPILPNEQAKQDYQETTPMGALTYHWQEGLMTYLSYSEGFKGGGYTQRIFPPQDTIPSFDPEFAEVYEVGFKWETSDKRLRLNGAYFFSDYSDLQIITQAETVAPLVLNAGDAEIQGVELDLQVVPADGWMLEASLGYLDAEYTSVDPGTGISTDNELVKAPKWSSTAAVTYAFQLPNGGTITPRVDYFYRDSYFNNAINSEAIKQDSFYVVNVGVTYENADGNWQVLVYGKNVNDENYISAGYSEQNGPTSNLGVSEIVRDRGTEWGLTAKYRFD
ncbi:MAG: TonB-dependent receptor [Pseudomonadota bacterium]